MFGPDIFKAFGLHGLPEIGGEHHGHPVAANPQPGTQMTTEPPPGPAATANPAANPHGALSASPLGAGPLKGVL